MEYSEVVPEVLQHWNAAAIGPARSSDDYAAAGALCSDIFDDLSFPLLQRAGAVEKWAQRLRERQGLTHHELLVARSDDAALLGCLELGLLPPPVLPEAGSGGGGGGAPADAPWIANVAVGEAARGRGIGASLLDSAEELCVSWGYDAMYAKVDRANIPARRLYDRRGYSLVLMRTSPPDWRNTQQCFLYLRKPIGAAEGEACEPEE